MPSRQTALALLLCAAALAASGCHKRVAQAAPPAPAPAAESAPQPMPPPEIRNETPPEKPATPPTPPPAVLTVPPPKPQPAKPKTPPPDPTPKPAPPQITPRLSPEEEAAAQRRAYEGINTAEKNLQVAYGKQLNDAQRDLVEKIRAFLGQSREAMRAADWVRARNLAEKAQILSVEL